MSERDPSEPRASFSELEAEVTDIFDGYRPGGSLVVVNAFAGIVSQAGYPEAERTQHVGKSLLRPYYGAAVSYNDLGNQALLAAHGVEDVAHAGIQMVRQVAPRSSIIRGEAGVWTVAPDTKTAEQRHERYLGAISMISGDIFVYDTDGSLLPTGASVYESYTVPGILKRQAITDGAAIMNLSLINCWRRATALCAAQKEHLGLDIDTFEGVWKQQPDANQA